MSRTRSPDDSTDEPKSHATTSEETSTEMLRTGEHIAGRYTTLSVLGRGGMGVVYAAHDAKLDRRVALKLLRVKSGDSEGLNARAVEERLVREAKALAQLSHPNVVAIYDVGRLFIAMELVEGMTLTQWLGEPRSWAQILAVFVEAGRGLAAAHAAGIIHRDFKADNVLIGQDGRARITDFGVVRLETTTFPGPDTIATADSPLDGIDRSSLAPLTATGAAPGTRRYMAPEIFEGRPANERSDLYSFCVALHEALLGMHPIDDITTASPARRRVKSSPEDGEPPGIPSWLLRGLRQGLLPDPAERPQSMAALLDLLDPPAERSAARRRRIALALTTLFALSAWGAFAWRAEMTLRAKLCRTTVKPLNRVWDDDARRRLKGALVTSSSAASIEVWKSVEANLDGYARDWAAMRKAACEPAGLRSEPPEEVLEQRLKCLSGRKEEFSQVIALLLVNDIRLKTSAALAVEALTPIDECADANLFRAPTALQAELDTLTVRIARASAMTDVGRYADALASLKQIRSEATALDHPPLQAEVLYRLGSLEQRMGDLSAAEATLKEAVNEAALADGGAGREAVIARAYLRLAEVVGRDRNRKESALEWARHARAWLRRTGGYDGRKAKRLRVELGRAYQALGRYDEAYNEYQTALSAQEKADGRDAASTATALVGLGLVAYDRARFDEAHQWLTRAAAIEDRSLGPSQGDRALTLTTLAAIEIRRQDYGGALQALTRGRPIFAALGLESALALFDDSARSAFLDRALLLYGTGSAFFALNRADQAVHLFEEALSLQPADSVLRGRLRSALVRAAAKRELPPR